MYLRCTLPVAPIFFILLAGLLFTALPAAGATAHRPTVEVLLSTGQTLTGELQRDDDDVLTVSQTSPRARHEIVGRNIVALKILELPDAVTAEEGWEKEPWMAVGKWALSKRSGWLAEHAFLMSQLSTGASDSTGVLPLAIDMHAVEHQLGKPSPEKVEAIEEAYKKERQSLPASLGGDPDDARPPRLYVLPTAEQLEANKQQAEKWFEIAKNADARAHIVESDHFIIYSTWPESDDKALVRIYTNMYKEVCEQFNVPEGEHVWIGRLPVYAFWEKPEFVEFCVKACEIPQDKAKAAGGFATTRGEFDAVVLGPVMIEGLSKARAKSWFFNLLVHESTHAFLSRYISRQHVPSWLNEGLAELIASELVPDADSDYKMESAHELVRKGQTPQMAMFTERNIPLDPLHYGAAQSMTRYLIAKDRKGYLQLIKDIKAGSSDADALKKNFDLTYAELAKRWSEAVKRSR